MREPAPPRPALEAHTPHTSSRSDYPRQWRPAGKRKGVRRGFHATPRRRQQERRVAAQGWRRGGAGRDAGSVSGSVWTSNYSFRGAMPPEAATPRHASPRCRRHCASRARAGGSGAEKTCLAAPPSRQAYPYCLGRPLILIHLEFENKVCNSSRNRRISAWGPPYTAVGVKIRSVPDSSRMANVAQKIDHLCLPTCSACGAGLDRRVGLMPPH